MRNKKLAAIGFLFASALALAVHAEESPDSESRSVTTRSTMSWDSAVVQSVMTLDAKKKGISLPTGREAALQMLDMETPALLKDSFFSVLANSGERLGDSVETGKISLAALYRVIDSGKKGAPYFSLDLKTVSMTHVITFAELGSLYVTHTKPYEPKAPLETVRTRAFTGILIDARGAKPVHGEYAQATIEPCLFPRIWDADMNLLYEKNMVEPAIARTDGIVRYTPDTDEAAYEDRIGVDPLRISVREIFGAYRTDPVISRDDARKILSLPENRALLREGKVVILCDKPALAMRNLGPVRDDAYYFAWQEISDRIGLKKIKGVDFTSTWEGLKLIMYDVRFAADTAKILPSEQTRLDAIADALKTLGPQARFVVSGHTAGVGKPNGEISLSVARAAKIADELVKRGIARAKISSTGFGSTKPVATNDTEAGRAQNRRVEITINLAETPAD